MKSTLISHAGALAALAILAAGCTGRDTPSVSGVRQTKFPGQVTAGGGTSGQVLARTDTRTTDATYAGGTPGIAGGSGGNTGGAATGGTVQESGQGPSQGTAHPSSAGRPGTNLPPGSIDQRAAPSSNMPQPEQPGNTAPATNIAPSPTTAPPTQTPQSGR
jgi:hypothetical protein